ncbi:Uncharacterised protein [Chlamydia trachomatis]|nr:Uncharacterised protein [Chlamydia trachomatis]
MACYVIKSWVYLVFAPVTQEFLLQWILWVELSAYFPGNRELAQFLQEYSKFPSLFTVIILYMQGWVMLLCY